MAISDFVMGNLTTIYIGIIVAIKAYSLVIGRSFGSVFVLFASTAVVGAVLIGTLTWDVSRKATCPPVTENRRRSDVSRSQGKCRGGICWHGVAVPFPASEVRFRLPQQIPYGSL